MVTTKKTPKTQGYEITVRGQYHASSEKGRVPKFFTEETFVLPMISEYKDGQRWDEEIFKDINGEVTSKKKVSVPNIVRKNTSRCALFMIKNFYIVPKLREKYEDFAALRTCEVVNIVKVDMDAELNKPISKTSISKMSESQLLQFVALHNMTITLESYPDLNNKKIAVKYAYEAMKKEKASEAHKTSHDPDMDEHEGFFSGDDENIDDLY